MSDRTQQVVEQLFANVDDTPLFLRPLQIFIVTFILSIVFLACRDSYLLPELLGCSDSARQQGVDKEGEDLVPAAALHRRRLKPNQAHRIRMSEASPGARDSNVSETHQSEHEQRVLRLSRRTEKSRKVAVFPRSRTQRTTSA